jgi:CBS-domain-containing membrane protein
MTTVRSLDGAGTAGDTRTSSDVRRVADVMTRGVVSAHEGAAFKDIAAAFTRYHISAVPVLDADRKVVGVITASDLLTRGSHAPEHGWRRHARPAEHTITGATAVELMTSPAVITTPGESIADAARRATTKRVRVLPVVDENGVLVGIVTRADLVRVYLRSDEEIRREVEDDVLTRIMMLEPFTVQAVVHQGVVTLRGCVDTQARAVETVELTRAVGGVIDVVDALSSRDSYQ